MEQTLSFEFEHEFVQNTERVKSVDLHPTEPWILLGLYSGTISVWNYQTKTEEKSLKISESPGHGNNVTAICAHPELPIIITASEDSTVKIWDAVTYRLQTTLNFGLERVWSIGYKKGSSELAFGCDKGFVIVKVNLLAAK
ncbi:Coatomer subunit beta'-1 [Spatholobus suberectus]|nr:Coatomer subunit beta'-1 [Spatholobus suberectus]